MNRPSWWSSIDSSWSAEPIPITVAPMIWLRAVLGLRILPAAMAETTRVTRTWPSSSSTFTSTNTAWWVKHSNSLAKSESGPASPITSIRSWPPAFIASAMATERDGSSASAMRPFEKTTRSKSALARGESSICRASTKTCAAISRHAFIAAVPEDAAVHEPPATGASAREVSPSFVVTSSIDRPSVSAPICVRIV